MRWTLILISMLLSSAGLPNDQQPVSVPTDDGSFEFNAKITVQGAPIISGQVTNKTSKDWLEARFKVELFDQQGRPLASSWPEPWTFSVSNLVKGSSQEIGLKG